MNDAALGKIAACSAARPCATYAKRPPTVPAAADAGLSRNSKKSRRHGANKSVSLRQAAPPPVGAAASQACPAATSTCPSRLRAAATRTVPSVPPRRKTRPAQPPATHPRSWCGTRTSRTRPRRGSPGARARAVRGLRRRGAPSWPRTPPCLRRLRGRSTFAGRSGGHRTSIRMCPQRCSRAGSTSGARRSRCGSLLLG